MVIANGFPSLSTNGSIISVISSVLNGRLDGSLLDG